MAILAGLDEAGLGPKLGPLVVALAVFRGPTAALARLPALLEPVVGPEARAPVPVGDSKRLFGSGRKLTTLERGVLAFFQQRFPEAPGDLEAWLTRLDVPDGRARLRFQACSWYREPLPLPRELDCTVLERSRTVLAAKLHENAISFADLRVLAFPAGEVNQGLHRHVSKNVFNFHAAAPLIRHVFDALVPGEDQAELVVDRQGGRKNYLDLLRPLLYPATVQAHPAGPDEFAYTVRDDPRRLTIRFMTRADRASLPVGLASMAAKYTRELHMTLFNRFWQARSPGLRATAGYPGDAGRFLAAIEPARQEAGVTLETLVRMR